MLAGGYPTSGPDQGVIEIREIPRPEAGAGEVLVRVVVSGVNPTDWKARRPSGLAPPVGEFTVPNQDGAGVIEAVGDGVDPARVGQRVWLYEAHWRRTHGTAAQWIALPADQAVVLPDEASFDLGASLGIPAITAHRCLFADRAGLAGARVLVQGGAGAVGHAAIELARFAGAHVCATVSGPEKAQLATAAGAELVVDYRRESVVEVVREWAPEGVDRIVEVDLAHNLEADAELLADGAIVSSYASVAQPVAIGRGLMVRNAELRFVLVYTIADAAKRESVDEITRALAVGALSTLPLRRFALQQLAEAHDAVEAGAVGKVLVDIP
jgi:NADPH2:quinone reductase